MRISVHWFALISLCLVPGIAEAQQALRIATEGAYPPFNYIDDSGELAGFDVDIAKALCADMQVSCTLVAVPWDGILDGISTGNYDVIIASMAYSEERAKRVDFTDPYYRSYSAFVADPAKFADAAPEALQGKRIATNRDTIQSAFLATHYPNSEIVLTPDQPEAYRLLVAGEVDLMLGDAIEQLSFLQTEQGAAFAYVGEPVAGDFVETSARIAVGKGNDTLKAAINQSLKNIKLDGTYDQLSVQYFPFSID